MKDEQGLYYYPFPQNRRVRMYVRQQGNDIAFRMWNADDAHMWEQHGWVPYEAIKAAAGMYKKKRSNKQFNPDMAYDIQVARALIRENQ